MEIVMLAVVGMAALSCLCANLLIAYMVWSHLNSRKAEVPTLPEETPEEKEARRLAAEAQKLYEQGFIDMMNFSGRPTKKDGETI